MSIRRIFLIYLIGGMLSLLLLAAWASFIHTKHPSDRVLMKRFQLHRESFEKLATMANEDSRVSWLFDDFAVFDDYKFWPKEVQGRFSWARWNEYDSVFRSLGTAAKHQFERNSSIVLIPVSVDTTEPDADYEYRVSVKGYAYSQSPLSSTVDSLDSLGVDDLGRSYKRIDSHWYLYHDCGIGKPE